MPFNFAFDEQTNTLTITCHNCNSQHTLDSGVITSIYESMQPVELPQEEPQPTPEVIESIPDKCLVCGIDANMISSSGLAYCRKHEP
jgi:hypothetical protein